MGDMYGNRYWTSVDPSAENNAHSYALDLVGHNKRVLELGPAAGHVTRALVERGCTVVGIEVDPDAAEGLAGVAECLVGDLNDPSLITRAGESGPFDVVLAGDVLEHLTQPSVTLSACRGVLAPGGYIVLSLPNVAHADIALGLLGGQFRYADSGLLDRTHLRFFTEPTIRELLDECGLTMIDLRRVLRPIFTTELELDPADYPQEVVDAALAQPEAETYQFVVRAVRHDGDLEVARLAARCIELEEVTRHQEIDLQTAQAEVEVLRASVGELNQALASAEHHRWIEVGLWKEEVENQARHLDAIYNSRTMRFLRPLRAAYHRVRELLR